MKTIYGSLSLRLLSILVFGVCLIACEDSNEESTNESMAGEATGGDVAGEDVAGGDVAGEEVTAGEVTAGEVTAGEVTAGETAGEEVTAGEVAGEEVTAGEDTPFECAQDALVVQQTRISPEPNLMITGIDDRFNFNNILQVELTTLPAVGMGISLEGSTPQDCDVCVYMGLQCEDGCAEVYFATGGEFTLTEYGGESGEVSYEVSSLTFSRIDREAGELDPPDGTCISDQSFSGTAPALVGDTVPSTFMLQNCETGDMVNVKEFGADAQGVFFIATAGWCPACRTLISGLFGDFFVEYGTDIVKPMIVVTEDDQYAPATLAFCKNYARRYTDDATHFYLDANLDASFTNIWSYIGDDGMFGLPWKVLIDGASSEILFVDGASGGSREDEAR